MNTESFTIEVVVRLAQMRTQIEKGCECPIHHLHLNAAAVLDDVAQALGLSDDAIRQVLGGEGYAGICQAGGGIEARLHDDAGLRGELVSNHRHSV